MLLTHERVEKVYFTGGVTDPAHNEPYVEYYDEQAGQWRRYFPDFFLKLADDGWIVIEVKREDQVEHPNVKAKDAAAREVFETLSSETISRCLEQWGLRQATVTVDGPGDGRPAG